MKLKGREGKQKDNEIIEKVKHAGENTGDGKEKLGVK